MLIMSFSRRRPCGLARKLTLANHASARNRRRDMPWWTD
jgi:hypothetical protein